MFPRRRNDEEVSEDSADSQKTLIKEEEPTLDDLVKQEEIDDYTSPLPNSDDESKIEQPNHQVNCSPSSIKLKNEQLESTATVKEEERFDGLNAAACANSWLPVTPESTVLEKLFTEDINYFKLLGKQVSYNSLWKEGKLACHDCSAEFDSTKDFNMHIATHKGYKLYKCDFCSKRFTEPYTLKKHINKPCTGKRRYCCTICDADFAKSSLLRSHEIVHKDRNPHKCSVCEMEFPRKQYLAKHMTTHKGPKKIHYCAICDKGFAKNCFLRYHELIHTGEKPFKCSACENAFRLKRDLTRHMNVHTGEKPFKCSVCEKAFRYKTDLTRHVDTHTDAKNYQCSMCEKRFSTQRNRRRHELKNHGLVHARRE